MSASMVVKYGEIGKDFNEIGAWNISIKSYDKELNEPKSPI
jgi:hypothetical protein